MSDDVLADLKAAAAAKWKGDPSAQQWGLFARAAAEIERLRADAALVRAQALEEAARVCDAEYLVDATDSADDVPYNVAVKDCVMAVRKLLVKPQSGNP